MLGLRHGVCNMCGQLGHRAVDLHGEGHHGNDKGKGKGKGKKGKKGDKGKDKNRDADR